MAGSGKRRTPAPKGGEKRSRRRRDQPIVIHDPTKCYNCKKVGLPSDINYCPSCGFPQGKSDKERKDFLLAQRMKRSKMDEMRENVKRAQYFLYFVAGFNFLFMFDPDLWGKVNSFIIGVSYLLLAYLSSHRPFICLLTALVLYVSLTVLTLILAPSILLWQIFIKVTIIAALIFGMNAALKAEKLQKELKGAKAQ
ncbi:MAG: hypothetical protein ABEH38_07125 [Flavobacteriales bacterium]